MLTCEQINRAIAKQRKAKPLCWDGNLDPVWPNYCRDWAAAGPLLEDMVPDTEAIARAYHAAFCKEE